jgi:hypothetical protein
VTHDDPLTLLIAPFMVISWYEGGGTRGVRSASRSSFEKPESFASELVKVDVSDVGRA